MDDTTYKSPNYVPQIKAKRDTGIKIYQYILGIEQFEKLYDGGSDKLPNVKDAYQFFQGFERAFQQVYPG